MQKVKSLCELKSDFDVKFFLGVILLLIWFFVCPSDWQFSLYSVIQSYINISQSYISGFTNMLILLLICFLCKYKVLGQKNLFNNIYKKILGAVILLICIVFCSLFFVHFTKIYQGNTSLIRFIIHQIIFIGFLEELLFRGILVWIVQKFFPSTIVTIIICASLFALSHINSQVYSLIQVSSSFIIGIIFTVLVIKFSNYFSILNLGIVHGVLNILILGFTTYMQII